MSDRRAGWFLVIVSAALAVVVWWMTYGAASGSILESSANAGEAAIALLLAIAPEILMVIALDIIAFVIGKDLRIRIVAVTVSVATVLGVMATGGVAALTSAPSVAEPAGPGAFACTDPAMQTPPGMQEAVDELIHPGQVDTIPMEADSCRGIVRQWPVVDAVPEYAVQLEKAGWTIDSVDDTWLTAHRGEFTFTISSCGDETGIEIRLTADAAKRWC